MKNRTTVYFCFLILIHPPVQADDKNQGIDFLDPYIDKLTFDPLKIGGSVAFEYRYVDYGEEDTGAGEFDFSRAKLSLSFKHQAYTAQATYGFYYYDSEDRWVNWLQNAWVGYAFNPDHQIRIGINKVPFGLLPYSSVSWYESLSYYIGLEEITIWESNIWAHLANGIYSLAIICKVKAVTLVTVTIVPDIPLIWLRMRVLQIGKEINLICV